jgi:hypothetical protein
VCWAAVAVIDGLVVFVFVRSVHHEGEIFSAAVAGIDDTLLQEAMEGGVVEVGAMGLRDEGWLPFDA